MTLYPALPLNCWRHCSAGTSRLQRSLLLALLCLILFQSNSSRLQAAEAKKIVLIAGPKSHGPVGNGIHDYPWSVKLLKVMLDHSNIADQVRVEYHLEGWPEEPATLDDADTIMIVSDGRDGELYEEAPHFKTPEHREAIARQMKRGCGFVTFHFSTFAPDAFSEDILNWSGAYFDWETDGKRDWYSKIQTADAELQLASPMHPLSRGLHPFRMKEEFYFNLRFRPADKRVHPILEVPSLEGRKPDGNVVAWAREREDGGRGFGTTCGHFYENWKQEDFRTLMLNALAWTAGLDVPQQGVQSRYFTHEEITRALTGIHGTQRAVLDDQPVRALILSGAHHPGHLWKETTPVLKELLERDPRMKVDVCEEIEDLSSPRIKSYDLLVQNYCNWERAGLSDQAKSGFVDYLKNGGGLIIVHFANGAFHASLPNPPASDWPEYRKICRRVWDHAPGASGHDAYGPFTVEIDDHEHPVTHGMEPFQTTDELYFRQQGTAPIHVLASARSKVTGQFEPMAFVYDYERGRIFQTVLGHSVDSLRSDGTAELLSRAAAWTAHRNQVALVDANPQPPNSLPAETSTLTTGRFGNGLNARQAGLFAAPRTEYSQFPMTVECWAKLDDKTGFNILVANEDKASATHWELFTAAQSGFFCAYLPGRMLDHARSSVNICDHQWHHLAMTCSHEQVCLYVDGKQVAEQNMTSHGGTPQAGLLALGSLADRQLGCAGVLDEVRISRGIRTIQIPTEPLPVDAQTIGLWRFDNLTEDGSVPDESVIKNSAVTPSQLKTTSNINRPKIEGHWGEEALGFRWTEADSVDSRWNQSEIGNFLASNLPIPGQKTVNKALSIRIGEHREASICFDLEHLKLRAAWRGDFLQFSPARFGIIESPRIAGEPLFTGAPTLIDDSTPLHYQGMTVHGPRSVLQYRIADRSILDTPWWVAHKQQQAVTRTLQFNPGTQSVKFPVLTGTQPAEIREVNGIRFAVVPQPDSQLAIALLGSETLQLKIENAKSIVVPIPASAENLSAKLLYWSGPPTQLTEFIELVRNQPATAFPAELQQPGPARWTHSIETRGTRGSDNAPYVLDTLTLPFENPYRALMFVSAHDFFSNGDIALSTVHGDVWRVSGIDENLQHLTWHRYATGLFQPLGLKVVDDQVYVLGRDQITRLSDQNGDHEADHYECFYNGYLTSSGGHDYVTCLETDTDGNFYFTHAVSGVVKVSRDGSSHEVLATGLRNPNGISVGPDNTITTTPQEGEWTPTSAIYEVQKGHHYGYRGPQVTTERPLGYDPPLCWIPRLIDNSTGGQVWATNPEWGPLSGHLLSFSFGKCRMGLVLREHVDGQAQGGYVDLPLDFDSGVMRGRFSPFDGQLYASGLRGWVSSAVLDGCLQRVRYTGTPMDLPVKVETMQNGLAITFSRPLDPAIASDPERYQLQQWNYLYSASYGSADYRVNGKLEEGHDPVEVLSATLLQDGRTVFLEIAAVRPVMQLGIDYDLRASDGTEFHQTISYTINRVSPGTMDPSALDRKHSPGLLTPDLVENLQPGLIISFHQGEKTDTRLTRLPALQLEAGTAPAAQLPAGPFTATIQGFLQVPQKGNYELVLDHQGDVQLVVDGGPVISRSTTSTGPSSAKVELHRGYHSIEIRVDSLPSGAAELAFKWKGSGFELEPMSPTQFYHDQRAPELQADQLIREGRELFATLHCRNCHQIPESAHLMLELNSTAPDLRSTATTLNRDWIAHWLLDPGSVRNHVTMPNLFDPANTAHQQQALDIATWLTASSPAATPDPQQVSTDLLTSGEKLYETLGCYACHRFTPSDEVDEYNRISLHHVAVKFLPGALATYLKNPAAHHLWTRMPDFRLNESETLALAAYLQAHSKADLEALPNTMTGNAERGQAAFAARGCAACHTSPANRDHVTLKNKSPFLARPATGCLNPSIAMESLLPRFQFTDRQRAALQRLLETGPATLQQDSPAEAAQRLITSLRCQSCHHRDHQSSPRAAIYLDELDTGFLPEPIPALTWSGDQLYSDWIAEFLKGTIQHKPRESLLARMPAFPAYADLLARGLAAEHGHAPAHAQHGFNEQQAQIGLQLTLKEGGLDCRQCHGVGRDNPVGDGNTKIAPGINFTTVRERIRPDFYARFVMDPPRLDVNTKMPKLATDGVTTKIKSHYHGNAHQQFDAIWNYIQSLPDWNAIQ